MIQYRNKPLNYLRWASPLFPDRPHVCALRRTVMRSWENPKPLVAGLVCHPWHDIILYEKCEMKCNCAAEQQQLPSKSYHRHAQFSCTQKKREVKLSIYTINILSIHVGVLHDDFGAAAVGEWAEITTQFNKWICHSSFVRQTQHITATLRSVQINLKGCKTLSRMAERCVIPICLFDASLHVWQRFIYLSWLHLSRHHITSWFCVVSMI